MNELSFGQKYDDNGLIMPWFTHGCLDWIKQQDWSEKSVFMFGAGMGDQHLSKLCKKLIVIERNEEWYSKCASVATPNTTYIYRPCNDSSGQDSYYLSIPKEIKPDIIVSDDAYRTEAVKMAIEYFKNKEGGGILICDNYNQSYVWRSPIVLKWLEPFEKLIFEQPDHEDYNKEEEPDGKWKTAVIFIK